MVTKGIHQSFKLNGISGNQCSHSHSRNDYSHSDNRNQHSNHYSHSQPAKPLDLHTFYLFFYIFKNRFWGSGILPKIPRVPFFLQSALTANYGTSGNQGAHPHARNDKTHPDNRNQHSNHNAHSQPAKPHTSL